MSDNRRMRCEPVLLAALSIFLGIQAQAGTLVARLESVHEHDAWSEFRLVVENVSDEPVLIARSFVGDETKDKTSANPYPYVRIATTVETDDGRQMKVDNRPLHGVRSIRSEDFVLLMPGNGYGVRFDLRKWPFDLLLAGGETYRIQMTLRFVGAGWVDAATAHGVVDKCTLNWLSSLDAPMYEGILTSDTLTIQAPES